ncbi:MAG: thrB, partial [Nocardioides sp.]|nr:thrB [Nocardioides sp.]
QAIRVQVPATSANLGPGFDALGLALGLYDEIAVRVAESGLSVDVSGEAADEVRRDERHLVVATMRKAFDALGGQPRGLEVRCANRIPHGRGLGSSSAAIVGGITLARALVDGGLERLDDDAAFRLAARLEGHPDNVAPACYGGFTISGHDDGEFWSTVVPVDPAVAAVVLVPPDGVSTEAARGLLPATVLHADAAANAGRAALLVAALAGRPELLLRATRDLLHQDHREPAMPESLALVRALRADGHAALVSGAGPTVLVLVADAADAAPLMARCPAGWRASTLAVGVPGASVVQC